MAAVITTSGTKSMIKRERSFWQIKESAFCGSGIIRSEMNSIVFSRQSGLSSKNVAEAIPHLNPLPLRKGEVIILGWPETMGGPHLRLARGDGHMGQRTTKENDPENPAKA